jgi:hypothetical protein
MENFKPLTPPWVGNPSKTTDFYTLDESFADEKEEKEELDEAIKEVIEEKLDEEVVEEIKEEIKEEIIETKEEDPYSDILKEL